MTLAGMRCFDEAASAYGFCFLTDRIGDAGRFHDVPLIVSYEHHEEWFDGWRKLDDVRSCAAPLPLFSPQEHS